MKATKTLKKLLGPILVGVVSAVLVAYPAISAQFSTGGGGGAGIGVLPSGCVDESIPRADGSAGNAQCSSAKVSDAGQFTAISNVVANFSGENRSGAIAFSGGKANLDFYDTSTGANRTRLRTGYPSAACFDLLATTSTSPVDAERILFACDADTTYLLSSEPSGGTAVIVGASVPFTAGTVFRVVDDNSGTPATLFEVGFAGDALIAGDVYGDGVGNTIFRASATTTDPRLELSSAIATLRASGSGSQNRIRIGDTFLDIETFTGAINLNAATGSSVVVGGDARIEGGPGPLIIANASGGSATSKLFVKGSAAQTASLQEWQNSAAAVLASVLASGVFDSNVVTGTAPFDVASTTLVTNLNADLLDGVSEAAFGKLADAETVAGAWTFSSTVKGTVADGGPASAFVASSAIPAFALNETDAVLDEKNWDIIANSGILSFRAVNDANSAATVWLSVDRTGQAPAASFPLAVAFTAAGAPFTTTSTTVVTNLNADLLDGLSSAAFYQVGGTDVAIADGGTGASTASAAFDALSPMTTNGDIIIRSAGTGARLPIGTAGQVLTVSGGLPVWAAAGAASITMLESWDANLATFPSSNPAGATSRNAHPLLTYDDTTAENVVFHDTISSDYAAGNVSVRIDWIAATATTGNVLWGVEVERLAAAGQDFDADGFAAQVTGSSGTSATSGVVTRTTIALSNAQADAWASGDAFRLRVQRVAASGSDTMVGDAQVARVSLVQ